MSRRLITDTHALSATLGKLKKLDADEYIVAFGARGEHFYGTPDGYHATHLPVEILNAVAAGVIEKVTWVSFGSSPDSWFFAFETRNGQPSWRCGPQIPAVLERILDIRRITPENTPGLLVQLGSADSFVFWLWPMWVCYDVPDALKKELEIKSASYQRQAAIETGFFSGDSPDLPDIITWHRDGSYYVHSRADHVWNFQPTMNAQWKKLWERSLGSNVEMVAMAFREIAHVAINLHTATSDHFVFIKKQWTQAAAPFIVHFSANDTHARLPQVDPPTQQLTQKTEQIFPHQWVVSKHTGRPNPHDSWELELRKGERIQIIRECGRDWYIVRNHRNIRGYAHHSWLDFGLAKPFVDPQRAYARFEKDMRQFLIPGQLRSFPPVLNYLNVCSEDACLADKKNATPRLCIHNLEKLLQASGQYSYEWLKEERNVWHPDKFGRFCHPDHKEELKGEAQELFVMYGVLMDKCSAGKCGSAGG